MRKNKKKSKNKFDILKKYRECWKNIKDSKKYILFVIGVFLIFIMVGFFIPAPEIIYNKILDYLKEILSQTENMSPFELICFIIINNIKSLFISLLLGIFFGIYPFINILINGYVLGFVSAISVQSSGIFSLWKLFPHGIFELPAVFISIGIGLRLGISLLKKDKLKSFKKNFFDSLNIFLLVVIPLLVVAGIIEGLLIVLIN